ncbi:MAG: hypothetical protein GF370_04715 [Candidatus Nealsonbacteria bacterium]|nr:hypothetical protein [Candidatus Nealsonbacteria bacterium]
MPKYFYTAKSLKGGEEETGTLEAKNVHELSHHLRQRQFILVKARVEAGEEEKKSLEISLPFKGVPLQEKLFFVRNLRVMTLAGLPLPKALEALSQQTKNKKLQEAMQHAREQITKGRTLSSALSDYPDIFSDLFRSMIGVGEESGTMDDVLKSLSLQLEKEYELNSKIKGALIYPAVIISAMLAVGVFMLVTVIPELAATFEDLGIELPATTQAVIGLADFLIEKWYVVVMGIVGIVLTFQQGMKREGFKKRVDMILLKIPVISDIIKKTNAAYMLRTLSSLLGAGTAFPQALKVTSGVLGNYYFKKSMTEAAEQVRKGEKLSEVLSHYEGVYPSVVIQMTAVGEETGETTTILSTLADFFEEEVGRATKNLASIIEPVLMLIIGVVIGFFAVSMIQPMYSMVGSL